MSDPEEPGAGVRWLTYRELAAALGVSLPAAEARVRRGRWPKQPGNDGTMRVAVPAAVLEPTPSPTRQAAPDATLAALVAAHDAATGELRRRAEAAEGRAAETAAALAAAEGRERDALARLAEVGEARLVEAAELGALRAEVVRLAADLEEARAPWWRRWFTR